MNSASAIALKESEGGSGLARRRSLHVTDNDNKLIGETARRPRSHRTGPGS